MRFRRALVLGIVLAMWLVPSALAYTRAAESNTLRISDAYYGDLDGDLYADDIKILVQFSLGTLNPSKVTIDLQVVLPSGTTYAFRIIVYHPPTSSVLQIDCFDMAYESGMYMVEMSALISGTSNGKYLASDTFMFDPPTGGGPGLPTVTAYF